MFKKIGPGFALLLSASTLSGCGAPESEVAHTPLATPPQTLAVVIDDTPVEPLALGGSMRMLASDINLEDPENARWREAQEYSMNLGMAPPVHPSVNLRYDAAAPAIPVFLRAATDGNKVYLRLRWPDGSDNTSTSRTEFADAAAIQFAMGSGDQTSFMMGAPDGPVNIWYWKAGQDQAQNLAAGGFGSTTTLGSGDLTVNSVYRDDGEWVVVFSRSLSSQEEHHVSLANRAANMAFAVWQGEQGQRDGLKHVSMGWVTLEPAS